MTSQENSIEVIVEVDATEASCEAKTITYHMPMGSTYADLYKKLVLDGFIVSKEGGNEVWALLNELRFCLFIFYGKTNKYKEASLYRSLESTCCKSNHMRLAYFDHPFKWSDYIKNHYNNNGYVLAHEGWMDEIIYCYELCEDKKYKDDVCELYYLEGKCHFNAIIDRKHYRYCYILTGHHYEPRIYFEPINMTPQVRFSVGGKLWFPKDDNEEEWKNFCYSLFEEVKAYTTLLNKNMTDIKDEINNGVLSILFNYKYKEFKTCTTIEQIKEDHKLLIRTSDSHFASENEFSENADGIYEKMIGLEDIYYAKVSKSDLPGGTVILERNISTSDFINWIDTRNI